MDHVDDSGRYSRNIRGLKMAILNICILSSVCFAHAKAGPPAKRRFDSQCRVHTHMHVEYNAISIGAFAAMILSHSR